MKYFNDKMDRLRKVDNDSAMKEREYKNRKIQNQDAVVSQMKMYQKENQQKAK